MEPETSPNLRKRRLNVVAGCSNWKTTIPTCEDEHRKKLNTIKESYVEFYELL